MPVRLRPVNLAPGNNPILTRPATRLQQCMNALTFAVDGRVTTWYRVNNLELMATAFMGTLCSNFFSLRSNPWPQYVIVHQLKEELRRTLQWINSPSSGHGRNVEDVLPVHNHRDKTPVSKLYSSAINDVSGTIKVFKAKQCDDESFQIECYHSCSLLGQIVSSSSFSSYTFLRLVCMEINFPC